MFNIDGWFAHAFLGVSLATIFAFLVWIHLKKDSKFDMQDLFLDPGTGKASLSKIIIAGMAVLSGWVVAVKVMGLYKGEEVSGMLTMILGIFVTQLAVSRSIDQWRGKDDDKEQK